MEAQRRMAVHNLHLALDEAASGALTTERIAQLRDATPQPQSPPESGMYSSDDSDL
jgi:hypothetical protein